MTITKENGYARYWIEEDEVVIDCVEAYKKRQGTGTELVNEVIAIAEQENKPCTLCAYPQDDSITLADLVAFYEALGFEIEYDTGDAVLMRR